MYLHTQKKLRHSKVSPKLNQKFTNDKDDFGSLFETWLLQVIGFHRGRRTELKIGRKKALSKINKFNIDPFALKSIVQNYQMQLSKWRLL